MNLLLPHPERHCEVRGLAGWPISMPCDATLPWLPPAASAPGGGGGQEKEKKNLPLCDFLSNNFLTAVLAPGIMLQVPSSMPVAATYAFWALSPVLPPRRGPPV